MYCRIKYADGRKENDICLSGALKGIRQQYPDAFSLRCLDRVLVWENEADSVNDDGYNAIAEIIEIDREMPVEYSRFFG